MNAHVGVGVGVGGCVGVGVSVRVGLDVCVSAAAVVFHESQTPTTTESTFHIDQDLMARRLIVPSPFVAAWLDSQPRRPRTRPGRYSGIRILATGDLGLIQRCVTPSSAPMVDTVH